MYISISSMNWSSYNQTPGSQETISPLIWNEEVVNFDEVVGKMLFERICAYNYMRRSNFSRYLTYE